MSRAGWISAPRRGAGPDRGRPGVGPGRDLARFGPMSSRTRSSANRPSPRRGSDPTADDQREDQDSWQPRLETPARLRIAVLVAAVGAVLLAIAPMVGVL